MLERLDTGIEFCKLDSKIQRIRFDDVAFIELRIVWARNDLTPPARTCSGGASGRFHHRLPGLASAA